MTAELELVLLCARTQLDPDQRSRISSFLGRDLDWSDVVQLATRHGLAMLLRRTLATFDTRRVSPAALQQLNSFCESTKSKNQICVRELSNVVGAFEAAGIVAVPYKGPALAAFLYEDFLLRQFWDLDFLVRPADAVRAQRALLNGGFVPKEQISPRWESSYVRFHCVFSFTAPRGDVVLELNWRITPWYWRLPDLPDAAWGRLSRLSFAGLDVPWLALPDLLLVLCVHGCTHKWERLKWIVDVAECLRRQDELDWPSVISEAKRAGSWRMLGLGFHLAHELLGAHLPAEVLEAIRATPAIASLAAEVRELLFTRRSTAVTTIEALAFLARAVDRLDARVACRALIPAYHLLHRVVRPGVAALRRRPVG